MYRALRTKLPPGKRGVGLTVRTMRQLIDQGGKDPRVITATRRVLMRVPERHHFGEVREIFDYVRDRVRFVNDPLQAEALTEPGTMIDDIRMRGMSSEDCDGHTVLLGSMLEAAGYQTELEVESYRADREPSHVKLATLISGGRLSLDPSVKDKPMGSSAGKPTKTYSEGGLSMLHGATKQLVFGPSYGARRTPAGLLSLGDGAQDGGLSEELTGQNSGSSWDSFFSGFKDIGDWAMQTPFVENWVMRQQVESAQGLAKLNKKFGYDVYASLYGRPADLSANQIAALDSENGGGGGGIKDVPTWVWGAAAAGVGLAVVLAMMGGRRRRR